MTSTSAVPINFAIRRSRSARALNAHPRTPHAGTSLGPRLARFLAHPPEDVRMMTLSTVTLDTEGGMARVTLNRPERLNAISPALLEDLWGVCDAVDGDPSVR